MQIKILESSHALQNLEARTYPAQSGYYAFFSSWLGGMTKDLRLMSVPMDDHMVHRGDGIFEAFKSKNRKVYLLDEHLARLARSGESIGLKLPYTLAEIKSIVLETLRFADQPETLVRLFVSRGPGGFTTNPYESIGSQLYVMITELKSLPAEKYQNGVKASFSKIPVKEPWMAQVKSCNYLPNVMMKKEALDTGFDFTIGLDDKGHIAEGSTENLMIVDQNGVLTHPEFNSILRGTTMLRAFELAKANGMAVKQGDFSPEALKAAKEIMMAGTTLDILPVTEFGGVKVSGGQVGEIAKKLKSLLEEDMKSGSKATAF